jgi:uncharacterized membrane protein
VTPARRVALVAVAGLLLVQWLWHGATLAACVYALPLLLLALLLASRRPDGWFWAGVLALPYLCHGIAEAWAAPPQRAPAIAEALLAAVLALAVSWDGMRARFAGKRGGDARPGGDANV